MRELPTGTVTFLFTDVEGSTTLLHELGAEAYSEALAEHRRVIREACAAEGGVEVDTQGDAFFFAFPTAPGALAAADAMTDGLAVGPIQVRIGLHTGTPLLAEEGYVGDDVHFAARVAAAGHGGQILLSRDTAVLLDGAALSSLGSHRLKDVQEPVTIYQLGERAFPRLKTIANSNLPTPASSFLGREEELYQADLLLQETRLLTVTGPGGAGKTRFALELATRARDERFRDYEDGIYSAFLSSLLDAELVPVTICVSLGLREEPGQSALEALLSHLQGKQVLLLLDNLEHLPGASPQLDELLSQCPGLTLLCTSRELLRLQGEHPYALPPLSEGESVSLFCTRSRLKPSQAIGELCARLEGLPLAIELAAARTNVLSPEQIVTRLSQRLDLLKGGPARDPRQETLRTTIQWSFELLSAAEQRLFARLSVFSGGCTLEAAEDVAEADLDTLQSLVEKSLVRFTDGRYWMLETLREFAIERFEGAGQLVEARGRHLNYVLELVAKLEATFASDAERETFSLELDNFRAALRWAEDSGNVSAQLDLVGGSWPFWWWRGHPFEGFAWVESTLASAHERDARRVKVLCAGAMFAYRAFDLDRLNAYAEESVTIARTLPEPKTVIWPLIFRGVYNSEVRAVAASRASYREAIDLAREAGEQRLVGIAENNLGVVAENDDDLTGAISHFGTALAISRELGGLDETPLYAFNLARCLHKTGKSGEAVQIAREGLELAHATGNISLLVNGFELLGGVTGERGKPDMAARLMGVAAQLQEQTGDAEVRDDWFDAQATSVRGALGDELYAGCLAEGRAMSLDEAVAYALGNVDA